MIIQTNTSKIINNTERTVIMLEILQYIFSSFWIWLGFTIIILIPFSALKEPVIGILHCIGGILNHKAECYRLARELILKNDEWNTIQKIRYMYQIRTKKGFDSFIEEHLTSKYMDHAYGNSTV
jgi:hypothetical protein|nr:MAG TPA: hypothetical protein [Caudoviricetes sp.]